MKMQSLNHWTSREFSAILLLVVKIMDFASVEQIEFIIISLFLDPLVGCAKTAFVWGLRMFNRLNYI